MPPEESASAAHAADAPDATVCQNCGAMASGNYCSNCGQSTDIHVPRLSEFLHEFISHHIAFEGALVASVKRLLISPGGLTLDYYAGRRARYVAPLRLYLTFNVIFFLAVQIFQLFGGAEDDSAKSALASLNSSDARQVAAEVEKDLDEDASLTPEQKRLAIEKLKLYAKAGGEFQRGSAFWRQHERGFERRTGWLRCKRCAIVAQARHLVLFFRRMQQNRTCQVHLASVLALRPLLRPAFPPRLTPRMPIPMTTSMTIARIRVAKFSTRFIPI